MKQRYKILLFFILHIALMLLVPFFAIRFGPDYCGMGISILLFFVVYPILSLALGVFSAIDIKGLWWMPLASSLIFPPLFSFAMGDIIIWDLYFYSIFYILI